MKKIISFLLAAVLVLLVPISLTSCGNGGACEYAETRSIEGRDISYVEMSVRDYGEVVILVDATTAPITAANFLSLVNSGFYNGLLFHRIIEDFMIQGGASTTGDYATGIYGEFSSNGYYNDIQHIKGVISMARTGNDPNSATTQFFICNSDARESLDGEYAAFGYVVEGLDVVDEITEDIFPKTKYASYYKDQSMDSYYYGYTKHYVWSQLGNGFVENESDMPVIEYIKIIDYNA